MSTFETTPTDETYWLWYEDDVVGSVRLPPGASADQVRARAIQQHDAVPLCYPANPVHHRHKLLDAFVVQYDDAPSHRSREVARGG